MKKYACSEFGSRKGKELRLWVKTIKAESKAQARKIFKALCKKANIELLLNTVEVNGQR